MVHRNNNFYATSNTNVFMVKDTSVMDSCNLIESKYSYVIIL